MRKYYPYPTRDPIKDYFPLPNEIRMLGLTPGEFTVYSYLMQCEDRKTHQCYPSYRNISENVHLSKNTVRKHICSLVEKRLITVEHTTIVTKRGEMWLSLGQNSGVAVLLSLVYFLIVDRYLKVKDEPAYAAENTDGAAR